MKISRSSSAMRFSGLAVAASSIVVSASCRKDLPVVRPEARVALFNGKDLAGWTKIIDPDPGPYGAGSDPRRVFSVRDGILRVSGERFGGLITNAAYRDYRLVVEFRWGEQRWPPRADEKRDSGVLLHCVGPDKVWPKSIECQIQEGDCGDFWMVEGATLVVGDRVYHGGRAAKSRDAERPSGEWNTVEVICDGDRITNLVNGVVVNEGRKAGITAGRILLQSEGAEVYFRKVELHPLGAD